MLPRAVGAVVALPQVAAADRRMTDVTSGNPWRSRKRVTVVHDPDFGRAPTTIRAATLSPTGSDS